MFPATLLLDVSLCSETAVQSSSLVDHGETSPRQYNYFLNLLNEERTFTLMMHQKKKK